MLIFDIDANIGKYAFANYSASKIICIESSPIIFERLKNNVKDYNKIICENYTVSTAKNTNTITLDELIEKYGMPDIIKVEDLELLTQKTPLLCFTYSIQKKNIKKSIIHLIELGYSKFNIQFGTDYEVPRLFNFTADEIIDCINSAEGRNYSGMIWCK